MRRSDQLINVIRRATENTTFADDSGIQDDDILQALNDGQDRIYSLIQSKYPKVFLKEKVLNIVNGQQAYSIPSDCYMGTRIERVEYSNSGNDVNYYPLKQIELWERDQAETGLPYLYIRRSQEILIQPAPRSAGTLRVTYQRTVPKLDKRRAKVLSVATSGSSITSLFLDPALELDATSILDHAYICIVDKDGVIKMKDIPVDAVNVTSGEVTVSAGFAFESGETIPVGAWVVSGKNASTHSDLDPVCEKYMLTYAKWDILKRDSSTDAQERLQELQMIEQEITDGYAESDTDPDRIPLISSDFLITDWD